MACIRVCDHNIWTTAFLHLFLVAVSLSNVASVEIVSGDDDFIPVGEGSSGETTVFPSTDLPVTPTSKPTSTSTSTQAPEICSFDLNDLSRIIIAINDGLDFFQDHIADLVLDAATGTRILEAQLQLVLREPSFNITRHMRRALNLLYTKSRVLSEQIVVNVQHDTELPESVKSNTMPWVKSYHLWQTPKVGKWSSNGNFGTSSLVYSGESTEIAEALNETVSDNCIGDLFRNCELTPPCAEAFLRKPHSRYSLTHQVIFMLVADKYACHKMDKSQFRSKYDAMITDSIPWNSYKAKLCEQVWVEANVIAESSYPNEFRDLMAEQIAVCSLSGYKIFLQRDWLNEILAWQNTDPNSLSNGCFSLEDRTPKGRIQKRSDILIQSDVEDEDCSVHFTAVSISALAMYLRHIMESCLNTQ